MVMLTKNETVNYCSFQDAPCNKILERPEDFKIFLAYPFENKIRDNIKELCDQKSLQGFTLFPWEKLSDSAGIIFCKICNHILSSMAIVADITYLNQNVLFELGFGIASKKVPILIKETGRETKVLNILHDIKRIEYVDIQKLAGQLSVAVCDDFPFSELDDISVPDQPTVLFINADANMPVKRSIYEHLERMSKELSYKIMIDDSSEILGHKFIFLLKSIEQSNAVLCHMVGTDFKNFNEINAQVSFLAGYALGRNKKILILQESPSDRMVDLQQVRREYKNRSDAIEILDTWLSSEKLERAKQIETTKKSSMYISLENKLSRALGHPAAEYDTSLDTYFIDTQEYLEAKSLRKQLFLGRRGSGKTANFLQLYKFFLNQPRNIIVRIIPSKLQLIGPIEKLHHTINVEKSTALFEMFWRYIILTEIAISCNNYANKKAYLAERELFGNIDPLLKKNQIEFDSEFDIRFNHMIDKFSQTILQQSTQDIRAYILSSFYKEYYSKMKSDIIKISEQHPIVVLIDNLDKDWSTSDMLSISSLINALLGVMNGINILNDFGNCKVVTFLRADVYKISSKYDPDFDKRQPSFMAWSPESLKQLICERMMKIPEFQGKSKDQIWETIYGSELEQIGNSFNYIIKRTMLKPRDLLTFCATILEQMIQKRQTTIDEKIILSAEEIYSEYLLKNLRQEYTVGYPDIEDICYSLFSQKNLVMTENQLKKRISEYPRIPSGYGLEDVIRFCFESGVLGVKIGYQEYFSYEGHSFEKLKALAKAKGEAIFIVHPGLYSALEINTKDVS